MNKQVIGIMSVAAPMANYNSDFSGMPRTTSSGTIFSTGVNVKKLAREMYSAMFPKEVFGLKSYKVIETKDGFIAYSTRTFLERYEYMFGVKIEDTKKNNNKKSKNISSEKIDKDTILNEKEIYTNLFKMIDFKNFGLVVPIPGLSRSIKGVVQINDGIDLTPNNRAEIHTITSSYSVDDKKASTIGNYSITEDAHYFHTFSVVPDAIKSFVEDGVTSEYSEEDYQNFKTVLLTCVTQAHSRAKSNCYNEFAIFIEMEPKAARIDLRSSIQFEKVENGKNKISFNGKSWVPELKNQILKVEVYVEPDTVEFATDIKEFINDFKIYDIRTNKEITNK